VYNGSERNQILFLLHRAVFNCHYQPFKPELYLKNHYHHSRPAINQSSLEVKTICNPRQERENIHPVLNAGKHVTQARAGKYLPGSERGKIQLPIYDWYWVRTDLIGWEDIIFFVIGGGMWHESLKRKAIQKSLSILLIPLLLSNLTFTLNIDLTQIKSNFSPLSVDIGTLQFSKEIQGLKLKISSLKRCMVFLKLIHQLFNVVWCDKY